jgi:microcystin-dependent protein
MAIHDYNIANAPGATVRADINALAEAIVTLNSGTLAPTVTFPFMFWMDTFTNTLKVRNSANNAWISFLTISGSTIAIVNTILPLMVSGSWYGTNIRYVTADTAGSVEIGWNLQFHPDAGGTEDYRAIITRTTGANGNFEIANTGSGTFNLNSGSGPMTINGVAVSFIPVGMIVPYMGATGVPSKWLFCYGQNINRTTYAALFAVVGTTYGAGDGSTTFTLPDLRGRTVAGVDAMGGGSADRITIFDGDVLGNAGGSQVHYLDETQIPAHAHIADPPNTALSVSGTGTGTTNNSGTHSHGIYTTDPGVNHGGTFISNSDRNFDFQNTIQSNNGGNHSHTVSVTVSASGAVDIAAFWTANTGGSTWHPNIQPTIMLNYMVYTGV